MGLLHGRGDGGNGTGFNTESRRNGDTMGYDKPETFLRASVLTALPVSSVSSVRQTPDTTIHDDATLSQPSLSARKLLIDSMQLVFRGKIDLDPASLPLPHDSHARSQRELETILGGPCVHVLVGV